MTSLLSCSRRPLVPFAAAVFVAVLTAAPRAHAADAGAACAKTVARSLTACVKAVGNTTRTCYRQTGEACAPGATRIQNALQRLATKVLAGCQDQATLAAAGYSPLLTPAALVERLQDACVHDSTALAARVFGGPRGAILDQATQLERTCLDRASREGTSLVAQVVADESACVRAVASGEECDTTQIQELVANKQSIAAGDVLRRCADLPGLIGLDAMQFTGRAVEQAHCLVAVAHGTTEPLDVKCGPRDDAKVSKRDRKRRVVLPVSTGARCANGSRYNFWVRLAPEGEPLERVVVFLQGAGMCTDEASCAAALAASPGRFESRSDRMRQRGILSPEADNPFAKWTKVFLPYCTQDLFTGGGVVEEFTSQVVHRNGAENVRAALRHVRDVIWGELDASSSQGYRPERMRVVLSGSDAGGYGAAYNLHYVLDDLGWTNTTTIVESELALDNGALNGIDAVVTPLLLATPEAPWAGRSTLPPYCLTTSCTAGPDLAAAHAPRLDVAAGQLLLQLSNQVDDVQAAFGNFGTQTAFINAGRAAYCSNEGANGLRAFLPATTRQNNILTTNQYGTLASNGVLVKDWIAGAVASPGATSDEVEEGTLSTDFGAQPISCL